MSQAADHLRAILNFNDLIHYLEEKLDWPLRQYGFDELTFEYQPEELGLKEDDAAKVRAIHQLRPLQHDQPWGIFFVEFENKKLPIVVLRRILSHLVIKKRASANKAGEAAWHSEDLMFITTFGEEGNAQREIAFAHFHQFAGDLPTLHVLGWDGGDTPLKLAHLNSDLQQHLRWPDNPADHRAWRQQWACPFRHRIGHVIRTADALAEALAALARSINEKATRMLAVESENGPLRMLYKAFQTSLIHELTEENFTDTYAQTITYGLLTAAISRTEWSEGRHGTFIIAENVTDMVPITNPFLKEMLQTFLKVGGRKGGIDFDELGVQDVVELLRGNETDLPAILRDFGNRTPGEDPVIHFYEHFLSAYNKKLKIQRGVFYTPQPVVSYIIRSVHELLQTEFGLEDGLASTITWGAMIEVHPDMKLPILTPKNPAKPGSKDILISPESPFVMILDIATGTGTFLVEIIDVIHKTMKAKWQKQGKREQEIVMLWNEYVPKYLLPRLYGYELMMAPYAIAHMKIGLKLSETGYKFTNDERVRVYLTNTLEPASDEQQQLAGILPALAHEAAAVDEVKRNVRFTVLVGNPPYSKSMSKHPWSLALINDFKIDFKEKKSDLTREEWKFLRFGYYCLETATVGILGIIINNAFLNAPTHRGIRKFMLNHTTNLMVYDLHGDSRKGEITQDGDIDFNVFEIQQGVCIVLGAMCNGTQSTSKLFKMDIWGTQKYKYNQLSNFTSASTNFDNFVPQAPMFFFRNSQGNESIVYDCWIPISEIFINSNTGIQTKNDDLFTDISERTLRERMFDVLTNLSAQRKSICEKYKLTDSVGWQVSQLENIKYDHAEVKKLLFKPFDHRFIYYSKKALGRARYSTMQHMLKSNIALIATRQVTRLPYCHVFVSRWPIEEKTGSHDRTTQLFPLYIYTEDGQIEYETRHNPKSAFADVFISKLVAALGVQICFVNSQSDNNRITPEHVFNYIYSILHSPFYRDQFGQNLMGDFPRIPLTTNLMLFYALAKHGGTLVALHLLESPKVNDFITRFTGKGDNSIPKKPTWKDNTVWINSNQRFEGVPENVWNFHIGGYQVCEKWLKDRKGRTLSVDDIIHYQRIIVALDETIRIMAEIDKAIDAHGGWPIK